MYSLVYLPVVAPVHVGHCAAISPIVNPQHRQRQDDLIDPG
jgi:hypothetical protein